MNFNHDTGLIDTILSIDTTNAPPLGGTTGVLTIVGTGGVQLPTGPDGSRPPNSAGLLRWNTTGAVLEYNDGSAWSAAGGSVTSVAVTGSTGLGVSGSPITTSGTITLTLGTELQGLSALAANGAVFRTASGTYTSRTITGTASNIVVTNGDGISGNPTINLATAGTAVTNQFRKITTDAYGRVTATSAVIAGDITTALGYTPVNKAGDTMASAANLTFQGGGTVTGIPVPSNATDAVPKSYVDAISQGLDPKGSVRAATTAAGTLATSFANGSTIDGVTLATNDRILIRNQAAPSENGLYIVQASGAPSRATDMDVWTEVPGAYVFVEEGSTLADTGWLCTSNAGGTLGSTSITWTQFSGAGSYTAGTGLTLSGTQFSLTTPVATGNGGTGLSSIGTANQVLGVNAGATGTEYKTIAQGTGITVGHTANTITITNAGVTSIAGTANQITASASTGSVTLSLPNSVTINTGLTVSGLTANSFLYSGTAGALTTTTAPSNGQLLIGSTGSAPVAATLTSGTGISVVNAAGSITINNTGVTSVGLSLPAFITVSGSPVTTTGTLTGTLASQTANTVFIAPNGSAGAPTFRTLAYADLPIKLYTENPSSPTVPTATGTNAVAIGSGAAAGANNSLASGDGSSASILGGSVRANGKFATAGDAQTGTYILRNITTNATGTPLFLDGSSTALVVPNNSVWTFTILVAGRRTDATGGGAGYKFEGVIRKDTSSASINFVGTPAKSVLGETNAAWNCAITADTGSGALVVTVTGEAAKTIRWVATVNTCEVTN